MRSMIVVAALAGGIWYSAPEAGPVATGQQADAPFEAPGKAEKWLVTGAGAAGGACTITLENAAGEAPGNVSMSSGCDAVSPVAHASKWWEDAEGNLVLASPQDEKIVEFSTDETEGLVSVWPRHTIVTLTPVAN